MDLPHFSGHLTSEDHQRPNGALDLWQKLAVIAPEHPLPHLRLAEDALEKPKEKRKSDPAAHYSAAISALEKRPYFPRRWLAIAHVGLAICQQRANKPWTELLPHLQAALKADDSLADAHLLLGQAHLEMKEQESARREFEQFLKLEADSSRADTVRQALKKLP